MEDILKRLLEAENQGDQIIREAEAERQRLIEEGKEQVKALEADFAQRLVELRQSYLEQAETQAVEKLAELKRHYEELRVQLRAQAERHEDQAVQAALALLLDVKR